LALTDGLEGPGCLLLSETDVVTSPWIRVVFKTGTLGTCDLCSLLDTLGCLVVDINVLAVDTVTYNTYRMTTTYTKAFIDD